MAGCESVGLAVEYVASDPSGSAVDRQTDKIWARRVHDRGLAVGARGGEVTAVRVDLEPHRLRVIAGSRPEADEAIGEEHDVVAGELQLADRARRVIERSDRPR